MNYKVLTKSKAKTLVNKKHLAFNNLMNQFWLSQIDNKNLHYSDSGFFGFNKIPLNKKGREEHFKLFKSKFKEYYQEYDFEK